MKYSLWLTDYNPTAVLNSRIKGISSSNERADYILITMLNYSTSILTSTSHSSTWRIRSSTIVLPGAYEVTRMFFFYRHLSHVWLFFNFVFLLVFAMLALFFHSLFFSADPRCCWDSSHIWPFCLSWLIFNYNPQTDYTMEHAYSI